MYRDDQSGFAQNEPHKRRDRPGRVWDSERQVWIEAITFCRRPDGPFTRKRGDEPPSQLCLFDNK
jgi:hypothetical protein